MEFGIQFFPDVGPGEKSAAQFWADALHLVSLCDPGLHLCAHRGALFPPLWRIPIVFLSAAAMRTEKARLLTGAVLPVFNNPLKLAG